MAAPLAALTGASGFLGGHVAQALAARGWHLRLLMRRPAEGGLSELGAEIVQGDLADLDALRRLCRGAQAVVHVAGLVKARTAAQFHEVNAEGAGRLAGAAREAAPGAAFVLVSSLAARAPHLSAYAVSKWTGEQAWAEALGARACIVRPPAIYGPGDRATLDLFRAAALSPVLPRLRREVRVPLIHVRDAAAAIATLASGAPASATLASAEPAGRVVALCDGRPEGHPLGGIVAELACAVGRPPRLVPVPEAALRLAGCAGDLAALLGATPILTSGKVRELLDGDWSLADGEIAGQTPAPRFGLADGLRDAVAGYRALGWLHAR